MSLAECAKVRDAKSSSPRHTNNTPKRLTCVPCRERKVRCDRAFPQCGRCIHLGHNCAYRGRSSNRANQVALINQLQERMSQAEARLAFQAQRAQYNSDHSLNVSTPDMYMAPSSSPVQFSPRKGVPTEKQQSQPPFDSSDLYSTTSNSSTCESLGYMDAKPYIFELGEFEQIFVSPPFPLLPTLELEATTPEAYGTQWPTFTPSFHPRSVSDSSDASITSEDLCALHQVFFDNLSPSLPIICQNRFCYELRSTPMNPSIQALSHAIALMTISVTGSQRYLEKVSYLLARRYLDESEIYGDERSFANLNALQTLIMVLRYELNTGRTASSYSTAARATHVAKTMRLTYMDSPGDGQGLPTGSSEAPFPLTNNQVELEEKRRCFWALYTMQTYRKFNQSINDGVKNTFAPLVYLPSPGSLDDTFIPSPMPYLQTIPATLAPAILSPFTATILTTHLAQKVLTHSPHPMPTFWDRHCALVSHFNALGALVHPYSDIHAPYTPQSASDLHLILSSLDLHLHAAALRANETAQDVSSAVAVERRRRLCDSALRIANAVRAKRRPQGTAGALALGAMFMPFVLSTAVRSLRTLGVDEEDGEGGEGVRVLLAALGDVEASDGVWHGMLEMSLFAGVDGESQGRGT